MNAETREAVLALEAELEQAAHLADLISQDPDAFDRGETVILQLAVERIMERVFQAATALPPDTQVRYFGADAMQYLRGMRNRLAHNYLGVDNVVLRMTIADDLPPALRRLSADAEAARRSLHQDREEIPDPDDWARTHLGDL